MLRTLNGYIAREIWPAFLVSLTVLLFIMLAAQILSITELVVTQGVGLWNILKLIYYLLPSLILFALPAASLISVLTAFLRVSSDNEIIAMQSSGISLYQILPPVFILSFLAYLIATCFAIYISPWGNRSFKDSIFMIAESKADLGIKERVFCEPFHNLTFYINSFSQKEKIIKDVFIVDSRDPSITNTIIAKEGKIFTHPKSRILTIGLSNGTVFMADKKFQGARTIKFDTYHLNIGLSDIMNALSSRRIAPKEMAIQQLLDNLEHEVKGGVKYNETLIELFEKFSVPLAVFLMGIIGAPLGAQLRAKGRSMGIFIGLMVFIIYYICLAGTRSLGETGTLPPVIGIWIPNLFLFIACIYLLKKASKSPAIQILDRIINKSKCMFHDLNRKMHGPRMERIRGNGPFPEGAPTEDFKGHSLYIGSPSTNRFHRPDCEWVERISTEKRVLLGSREDALDKGYISCKVCRP